MPFRITNVGSIDEIDPRLTDTSCGGVSCGPVVVNSFVMLNCMPTGIVQGPGNNFLVGCARPRWRGISSQRVHHQWNYRRDRPTEINNVGGVDEAWYNPADNKYYLAARDMPNGPIMGVIDAGSNLWLENVTTNANSHSIAVDPTNNHVFVPLQAGAQLHHAKQQRLRWCLRSTVSPRPEGRVRTDPSEGTRGVSER